MIRLRLRLIRLRLHLRHRWEVIEAIGLVVTQRCRVCGKTRVRVL